MGSKTLKRRISGCTSSSGMPFTLIMPFPRLQCDTATAFFWGRAGTGVSPGSPAKTLDPQATQVPEQRRLHAQHSSLERRARGGGLQRRRLTLRPKDCTAC